MGFKYLTMFISSTRYKLCMGERVKAAAAHHPIIQKEVDELLAKGAIKPASGNAGFYASVFIVPKHPYGLWPILNLKQFNH